MDPTSLDSSSRPLRDPAKSRLRVVAAVVWRGDRLLMTQRPPKGPLGLQWEFPGGKIEPGESAAEALVRELREELGVGARTGRTLAVETHDYTQGPAVEITFLACDLDSEELRFGPGIHDLRWWRIEEIDLERTLAGDRPFLTRLKAGPRPPQD